VLALSVCGGVLATWGGNPASAQPVDGLYVAGGAGYDLLQNEDVRAAPQLGLGSSRLEYNGGVAGIGSVGYGFGNGIRLEVEGDYLTNTLHARSNQSVITTSGGSQQDFGGMANALFDLDIGSRYVFPYVGAGLGYQWTQMSNIHTYAPSTGTNLRASGTYDNLAYQAIIGASLPVPHLPGLSLTAEYRFMSVFGPENFSGSVDRPPGGDVALGNTNIM
jgi:hypothetical protein